MILIKRRQWFHFITGEIALRQDIGKLVFGINIFDLDLLGPSWFCQTANQTQLCGYGTRVSLSDLCLQKSSWLLLRCLRKCKARRRSEKVFRSRWHDRHWSIWDYPSWGVSSFWCWCVFLIVHYRSGFLGYQVDSMKSVILQEPNPRDRERVCHPCANLHLKRQRQIQQNCVRLKFVSYTSNLWWRMFYFRRYIEFTQKSILSIQGLQQSLSLGTIPINNTVPYYPHSNIACNHPCYECKRSNEPSVCHMLSSILWLLLPVCVRNMECLVYHLVPNKDISRKFVSRLLTILLPFPCLPFWSDVRHDMV